VAKKRGEQEVRDYDRAANRRAMSCSPTIPPLRSAGASLEIRKESRDFFGSPRFLATQGVPFRLRILVKIRRPQDNGVWYTSQQARGVHACRRKQ